MTGGILTSVPGDRRSAQLPDSVTQMRPASIVPLCSLFLLLTGCISTMGGAPLLPDQNADELTYYVVRRDRDGRDLASDIAAALGERGLEKSSEPSSATPEGTDPLVAYVDKCPWDVRMVLYDLRIEVRDPTTGAILGWGESVQSSLAAMGKTFSDVIDRALAGLFGEPPPW